MAIGRWVVAIPITRAAQLGSGKDTTDSIVTETYLKTPNSLGRRVIKRTFGSHTTYEYDERSLGAATNNFFTGSSISKEEYTKLLEESNLALPEVYKRVITSKDPRKLLSLKLIFLPFWKDKSILEVRVPGAVQIPYSYKPYMLKDITDMAEYSDLVLTISESSK